MADSQNNQSGLAARLETYPHIEERLKRLLDLMENRSGELIKADDIEMALIPEVRGLGRELLEAWAQRQEASHQDDAEALGYPHHSKKNSIGTPPLEKLPLSRLCKFVGVSSGESFPPAIYISRKARQFLRPLIGK